METQVNDENSELQSIVERAREQSRLLNRHFQKNRCKTCGEISLSSVDESVTHIGIRCGNCSTLMIFCVESNCKEIDCKYRRRKLQEIQEINNGSN